MTETPKTEKKDKTMHCALLHYTSGPKAILETQTSMIEGGEDGGQKGHTDSHLLTTHPHEGGDLLLAPNKDTHRQRQQKWGEKFTDTGKGE